MPQPRYGSFQRAAASTAFVAGLLSAAAGLRFVTHVIAREVAPRLPESMRSAPSASAPWAASAPSDGGSPTLAAASALPTGGSIRVTLMITAGAARSEVFVNRARVGNTPFMGDVTCKAGERVRIELMPPVGAPRSYDRTCAHGTLRVE